jgi:uncharacterized protein DUF2785
VTNWAEILERNHEPPDELDAAVAELVTMLAAPDPAVRDDQAYGVLASWIKHGVLDERLTPIGDEMAERLHHPQVQARTFAPLILAAAVERDTEADVLTNVAVRRWWRAFADWWPVERDTRGWDERLGWLHAVAHGADLAGALGASRRMTQTDLHELLIVVGQRVVAPSPYRYEQMEEDRIARALARILARPQLTADAALAWLSSMDSLFATGGPGPVPIPVANTLAVLRAAYVMIDRDAIPHRTVLTNAIAARLHGTFDAYPLLRS